MMHLMARSTRTQESSSRNADTDRDGENSQMETMHIGNVVSASMKLIVDGMVEGWKREVEV
jgi:hypothetical protein